MIEGEWDITKGMVKKFIQACVQELKKKISRNKDKKMPDTEKDDITESVN